MAKAKAKGKGVRATVRGRVQGIGFREATVRRAEDLGALGWVRNEGDTVVRTGEVLVHRPSLILPPNIPQLEGFDSGDENSFKENTMINFLMVRGITLPSMKYDNKISSLNVFEGKMDDAIGFYGNRLQREENTSAGLICGPDDVWQLSLLIFVCSQIAKNSSTDIKRLLDEYHQKND